MGEGVRDPVRVVANIFISFIGAGVLGLPYAFKEAGLLEGVLIMMAICYFSVKAMLQLVDCKYKVQQVLFNDKGGSPSRDGIGGGHKVNIQHGKEYTELKCNDDDEDGDEVKPQQASDFEITYSDIGFATLGRIGRYTIDTALLISQVGFCCAYLIFITENLASFFPVVSKNQWLVLILPPLLFLTMIPDLGRLAIFSLIAQISNLFAFAVVFWFDFDHLHLASNEHRKEFSIKGFPFFFSVAIYCFEGAGMILSLEQSLCPTIRSQFKRYFVWTIVAITLLYVTFGCSGYLSYGPETKDIITLNLPSDRGLNFADMVKGCLCFSLFFTYPVMLFPVTTLLEKRVWTNLSPMYSTLLRTCIVTITGIIVIIIPKFADLMALVGATCCTLLAFIMPGLMHLIIFKKDLSQGQIAMDYSLVIIGVVGAILGTVDAIVKVWSN